MNKAYLEIEKLCLEALHNGDEAMVCNFVKDGYRYVSDGYCLWILPEKDSNVSLKTFVNYPDDEKMKNRMLGLAEKYLYADSRMLTKGEMSVYARGMQMTEYVCATTGDEVWLQDKYVKTFEPFCGWLCTVPNRIEYQTPILVRTYNELLGLIMPMHIRDEVKSIGTQASITEAEC